MPNIYRRSKKNFINHQFTKNNVVCKPLTDNYLSVLQNWFKLPMLKQYLLLNGWNIRNIKETLHAGIKGDTSLKTYIFLIDGKPFGFGQFFPIAMSQFLKNMPNEMQGKSVAVFNFFINDEDFYENGYAARVLKIVVDDIWLNFDICIISVQDINDNLIKFLVDCKFQKMANLSLAEENFQKISFYFKS